MLLNSQVIFKEDFEAWNPMRLKYSPSVSGTPLANPKNVHYAAIAEFVFGKGDWFEHFRSNSTASKVVNSKFLRHVSKKDAGEKFHYSNNYDEIEETVNVLKVFPDRWELHQETSVIKVNCSKATFLQDCRP